MKTSICKCFVRAIIGILLSAAALMLRHEFVMAEIGSVEHSGIACGAVCPSPPEIAADDAASEDELRALMEEMLNQAGLEEWDDYLKRKEISIPNGNYSSCASALIQEIAENGVERDAKSVFDRAIGLFIPQLASNAPFIGAVFAISALGGVCGILFKGDGMNAPVKLVLASAAALTSTASFSMLASNAKQTSELIGGFCEICAPALALLLTACGCDRSAALLIPNLSLLASWTAALISEIVIPLLLASGIMCVIGSLSEKLKLFNAVKLIHKSVKWLMGLAAVIYASITVIGGSSAAAMDGAVFKSAKYAVDKLLPFGGGMITATAEAAASSIFLAKNAVGTGGILVCLLLIASPLIKIAGGLFAFRIAAALCEPFSDDARLIKMLSGIADTISCLFAACACSGAMLVLTIGVIIAAGSTFI